MQYRKLFLFTALGLACCLAFSFFIRSVFGPAGRYAVLLSYPLYALVLWPLVERLTVEVIDRTRHAALKDVQGCFYSYQGFPIKVIEDADHCRWVPTSAIRSIAGVSTTDHLFSKLYPSGWRLFGSEGHLRDDVLGAYLASAASPKAIGLRNWAQRAIVYPAQKVRARLGIVIEPATEARP
jgi:hypothetical protein